MRDGLHRHRHLLEGRQHANVDRKVAQRHEQGVLRRPRDRGRGGGPRRDGHRRWRCYTHEGRSFLVREVVLSPPDQHERPLPHPQHPAAPHEYTSPPPFARKLREGRARVVAAPGVVTRRCLSELDPRPTCPGAILGIRLIPGTATRNITAGTGASLDAIVVLGKYAVVGASVNAYSIIIVL